MTKLKLGAIETDKPVRVSIRLPAPVFRDVQKYGEALAAASPGQPALDPARLIPAMVEHFLATDRGFAKIRREGENRAANSQKSS